MTASIHKPKSNAVRSQHQGVWLAWQLTNDSIFVSSQWISALVSFSDHAEPGAHFEPGCGVFYFRNNQANICGFVSWICLSGQKRYSASDLIDILWGQEDWAGPRQANSFSKGHGVGCWWSLLKDISGLVKATIRDASGVQIIPLIQSWQPGWWVNVVVLMQMVMIIVSSYRGQLWETGGMGHGWLRIFWVLAQKSIFWYLSHTRESGETGVLPSFGLGSDVLTHKKFFKYVKICIQQRKSLESIKGSSPEKQFPFCPLQFRALLPVATTRVSYKFVHKNFSYMKAYEDKYKHTVLKAQTVKNYTDLPVSCFLIYQLWMLFCIIKISLLALNYSVIDQRTTNHDSFT